MLVVFTSACGNAVKNLEERARQEAAAIGSAKITSVSPDYGDVAGGATITITGSSMDMVNTVTIGSSCTIVSQSSTSLTCTLAAGSAGETDVVIVDSKSNLDTLTDGFTYLDQPTVTSVTPAGGDVAGGNSVTITGTGFFQSTNVEFGSGNQCTNIVVVDSTTITCDVPAVGASTVDVIVTNIDTQQGTGSSLYTYKTPATITSIRSTTPGSGYYRSTQDIDIDVAFSEAITTTNSTLTLSTGGTASYLSGSGTTTLTYRYDPGVNDQTTDLDVTKVNVGDAVDSVNVPPYVTIPGGHNLADNNTIVLDNSFPTISNIAISSPADATYGAGQLVNILVTFSEAVFVNATTELHLNSGGTATYSSGSLSSSVTFQYTTSASENTTDLNVSSITVGDATDLAGNVLAAALPNGNNIADAHDFIVDTTGPEIVNITSINGNGRYNAGDVVTIQVNFNEAVIASTPTLTLDTGEVVSLTSGSTTSSLMFDYTIPPGQNSSDLTVSSVSIGDTRDGTNNAASGTIPGGLNLSDFKNIIVDTTDPQISSITSSSSDGTYAIGDEILIEVNFDEAISTSTSTLTLDSGGTAVYDSGSGSNTVVYKYTVAATEDSADLSVTTFNLGDTLDLAGNTLVTAIPVGSNLNDVHAIVIDTTAPTIANITSSKADGNYTAGEVIEIDVTLSENVTTTNMILNLNSGGTASYLSGSGTLALKFEYTVGASDNSTDLAVSSITVGDAVDDIGNPVDSDISGAVALETNKDLIIDTTAPTVTSVVTSTVDGAYTTGEVIYIDVNFSEDVTATSGSLTLNTTGSTATATFDSTVDADTLRYEYTVAAPEESAGLSVSSITVGDGVDAAGNAIPTSIAGDNLEVAHAIVIDTVAPTVTSVTTTTVDGSYGDGTVINIDVNFSENVTATSGSLTLNTTGASATATFDSSVDSDTLRYKYTVAAPEESGGLSVSSIVVGDGVDLAGNPIPTSIAGDNLEATHAIVIDTTDPTIASITSSKADGSYAAGEVIDIEVTFSEAVTATTSSNLTVDASGGTVAYSSGSGTDTLTFTYTVVGGDNSTDLAVTAIATTAIFDLAGNALNNSTMPTGAASLEGNKDIVIDATAPTIISVTTSTGDGTYGQGEVIYIDVNFNEDVTATSGSLTLNTTGATATATFYSEVDSDTLRYQYTVASPEKSADPLNITSITVGDAADTAGNPIPTSVTDGYNLEASHSISIDTTEPSMQTAGSPDSDATLGETDSITITVVFDKAVNVDATTELNLDSGGKATYVSGSGTDTIDFSYTVGAGESSSDLTIDSITIGDGTDLFNNPLSTALPASTNIADSHNFIVDSVGPRVVEINSLAPDQRYREGENLSIEITFDEVVSCTDGSGSVELNSGTSVAQTSGCGSSTLSYEYTVGAGQNSLDLNVSAINAGDAKDFGGNVMDTRIPAGQNLADRRDIIIDTTAPTITNIVALSADGTYGNGESIAIEVTFSEVVEGMGPALNLNNSTGEALYNGGTSSDTYEFIYTVASGHYSDYLNVSTFVPNGLTDLAGNPIDTTLPSGSNLADNSAIVIDAAPPTVSSISPQGGSTAGGTVVTISGANFDLGLTNVTVGGAACSVVSVIDSTQLTCKTGAVAQGFADVVVTNLDEISGTLSNGFLFSPGITINSISQSSGSIAGGDTITITGTNFVSGVISVDIGGVACGNVTFSSLTEITCDTGPAGAGIYDVNINQYFQTATLSGAFTYVDGAVLTWQTNPTAPTANPEDYGLKDVNESRTFTLENTGSADSSPITINITGANSSFWIIGSNTCNGAVLAPAQTCTVDAIYMGFLAPSGSWSASLDAEATSGGSASNGLLGQSP